MEARKRVSAVARSGDEGLAAGVSAGKAEPEAKPAALAAAPAKTVRRFIWIPPCT
jgi:hypothetical protein